MLTNFHLDKIKPSLQQVINLLTTKKFDMVKLLSIVSELVDHGTAQLAEHNYDSDCQ